MALAGLAAAAPSALARPGNLDPSFGKNGRVVGEGSTLVDMAALTDGRIVVATENALFAYRPNGRPDPSFGDNGMVEPLSPEGGKLTIEDLVVDRSGRVVAAGSAGHADATVNIGSGSYAAIARYMPSGELDGGFGSNGVVFTDLGLPPPARPSGIPSYAQASPAVEVRAFGVAIDSGERMVLTGTRAATYTGTKSASFVPIREAFVARLSEGGSRDTSFGEGGVASLGGLNSIGRPAIDNRAGIYFVAAALGFAEVSERSVIGHLDASGSVDLEFGKDGWRTLTDDASESSLDVTLDRKGRLLIHGQDSRAGIGRFKPNGSVDRSFGRDGVATIVRPGGKVIVEGLAVTRSGSILVAGSLSIEPTARGKLKRRILLTRLTHEGKPARRFGARGTVVTRFGPSPVVEGRAVLADGNGHALVGGNLEFSRFVLALYLLRG